MSKKDLPDNVAPNECSWGEKHQGTFRLNYDNRWEKA